MAVLLCCWVAVLLCCCVAVLMCDVWWLDVFDELMYCSVLCGGIRCIDVLLSAMWWFGGVMCEVWWQIASYTLDRFRGSADFIKLVLRLFRCARFC